MTSENLTKPSDAFTTEGVIYYQRVHVTFKFSGVIIPNVLCSIKKLFSCHPYMTIWLCSHADASDASRLSIYTLCCLLHINRLLDLAAATSMSIGTNDATGICFFAIEVFYTV